MEEEIGARGSFCAIPQFIANTRFKINCFTLTAYIVGFLVVTFEIGKCFDTTGKTVFDGMLTFVAFFNLSINFTLPSRIEVNEVNQ